MMTCSLYQLVRGDGGYRHLTSEQAFEGRVELLGAIDAVPTIGDTDLTLP